MKKIIIELVNIILRVFIGLATLVAGFAILGCFENVSHQGMWGCFAFSITIFVATLIPDCIKLKKQ